MTTDSLLLYAGTEDGLESYRLDPAGFDGEGGLERVASTLAGNAVRSIAVHPAAPETAYVGCGLRGWGLHRTTDGGRTTDSIGFADEWVWGVTFDPTDDDRLYVGTEPPALYRVEDDERGLGIGEFAGIRELPSRPDWTFFHEPFRAGHLYGIAIHPAEPDRIYAGVEHGALVYSHDGGESWREALVGRDLHRLAVDPTDPDRVLAGAGSGLYESRDAGESWERLEALAGAYVHGIAFAPTDPSRVYCYADGPNPVRRSDDGGRSWLECGDLPAARPADPIAVSPHDADRVLYAGDEGEGSTLFASRDAGETWTTVGSTGAKLWRLAVAPVPGEV